MRTVIMTNRVLRGGGPPPVWWMGGAICWQLRGFMWRLNTTTERLRRLNLIFKWTVKGGNKIELAKAMIPSQINRLSWSCAEIPLWTPGQSHIHFKRGGLPLRANPAGVIHYVWNVLEYETPISNKDLSFCFPIKNMYWKRIFVVFSLKQTS